MSRRSELRGGSLLLAGLALGFGAVAALAEVRAVEHPSRGWSVEIEAARGGRAWAPIVPYEFDLSVLNPEGDFNGDGRPVVGVRPVVEAPEAVWPMFSPQGFDLALARHDGSGWTMVARITPDTGSDDTNPVLAYDDVGRSMLLWVKSHATWAVMVAGLSLDGRTWGMKAAEPYGFRPLAMQADGHEFYFATINVSTGLLRFHLVAFPFPNGGPALPFPDESLDLLLMEEIATGTNIDEPHSAPQDPLHGRPSQQPATLAALSLEMHRHETTVWADWVTGMGTVRWIAFRSRMVLADGEEPFRSGQVDQARNRIRRIVEDL